MIKKSRCLSFGILAGLLLPSCVTFLSEEGRLVDVVEAVSPTCQFVMSTSNYENRCTDSPSVLNALRNEAAKHGANKVVITASDCAQTKANMFVCPATFEMSDDHLKILCDKNNADACIDLGSKLSRYGTLNPATLTLYKKSCDLRNQQGCLAYKGLSEKLEFPKLKDDCIITGDTNACLKLSERSFLQEDLAGALDFAKHACSKGNENGCDIHRKLYDLALRRMQMEREMEDRRHIHEERKAQTRDDFIRSLQKSMNQMGTINRRTAD